jgi:hypothetical protein
VRRRRVKEGGREGGRERERKRERKKERGKAVAKKCERRRRAEKSGKREPWEGSRASAKEGGGNRRGEELRSKPSVALSRQLGGDS